MGMYHHIARLWSNPTQEERILLRKRLVEWRAEAATIRIPKPTRLDRARAAGYRAKPGIIMVRQRVDRGGRQRPDIRAGRRSKHARQLKILSMNYQTVAERRAATKFPNMEVLNSYFVGKDGTHYWYEVIMADKMHPVIMADSQLSWLSRPSNNRRVFRGITSAARRSRGLMNKGKGAEKIRPSQRAHNRTAK